MKFISSVLICVVTLFALVIQANAADYTTKKTKVISIDPLDLLFEGRINATFETKMSPTNSLTINATYWNYTKYFYAIGAGASYRWYVDPFEEGKKGLNGFSVGPRAEFFSWTWDPGIKGWETESEITLSIGAEVAYKWTFSDKWVVEPIFKLGFPVKKPDWGGWSYTNWGLGVNLGHAF